MCTRFDPFAEPMVWLRPRCSPTEEPSKDQGLNMVPERSAASWLLPARGWLRNARGCVAVHAPGARLYAISTGVGSAREIERLVSTDAADRWIVGDREVSHQTPSKFRVEHGADADDPELTRFQQARREAAARDFQQRVEAVIATVAELQQTRRPADEPARVADGCRGARDEDGRRRRSPGLQHPHGHRRLAARWSAHDRRRAGHQPGAATWARSRRCWPRSSAARTNSPSRCSPMPITPRMAGSAPRPPTA